MWRNTLRRWGQSKGITCTLVEGSPPSNQQYCLYLRKKPLKVPRESDTFISLIANHINTSDFLLCFLYVVLTEGLLYSSLLGHFSSTFEVLLSIGVLVVPVKAVRIIRIRWGKNRICCQDYNCDGLIPQQPNGMLLCLWESFAGYLCKI